MGHPPTPAARTGARSSVTGLDAVVSEMLKVLARGVRAHQLYLPNNPMHARALDAVRESLGTVWRETEGVELVVTESEFLHDDVVVFAEAERAGESLPWLFYKDGVRSFELRPGFEGNDLVRFLDAIQNVRKQTTDDDLVTLFWECDFEHFTYQYVDVGGDGYAAPGAELLQGGGGVPSGTIQSPADNEADTATGPAYGSNASAASASPFARMQDFDSTLYFLDETEIEYLQTAIHQDFTGDLRPSVVAALLDTFESEADPTVREEICGILESFLLLLLANLQFRSATYLLRECDGAIERAASLLPSHRQRLVELVGQLSEPIVLGQLLETLEDALLQPPQQDLVALFGQLGGRGLEPLVVHLVRSRNPRLRALLESAVTRIASSNTAELVRLIESDDEAVVIEAVRRAADLRSPAAVAPLARVLHAESVETRRVAVRALAQIGSAGAMQVLEQAIDDSERAIRVAVVQACVERQHRAVLPRLERAVKDRILKEANGQEKTAFFDAYATLGGDGAVPFLDGLLNPKGLLARKEDAGTRASAAMALGKLGSPRALDAVRRASSDKDVVVRNAAARALRGGGGEA